MGNSLSEEPRAPDGQRYAETAAVSVTGADLYTRLRHIPEPTLEDLQLAAFKWDEAARKCRLAYAFVGPFALAIRGYDCKIHDIQILIKLSSYEGGKLTNMIRRDVSFELTPTYRGIIMIKQNEGVALQFV